MKTKAKISYDLGQEKIRLWSYMDLIREHMRTDAEASQSPSIYHKWIGYLISIEQKLEFEEIWKKLIVIIPSFTSEFDQFDLMSHRSFLSGKKYIEAGYKEMKNMR